jgi:DNA-binding Lrp family transcriptional regulator
MDEVDIAISRMMLMNSRRSYSEMGKELGLTPQAVHRRVQVMMDEGIIRGTVARLTPKAMGVLWVVVFGWSRAASMDVLAAKLARSDRTAIMFAASGNFIYVHGIVPNTNRLADFVTMVQREAQIADAQVGILPTPPAAPEGSLSSLDLRLLAALRKDTRRTASELAKEIGTTAKTVRRRLDRLTREGLVSFSIHWHPDNMGDTMAYVHLHLLPEAERDKVALLLVKKYSTGMLSSYAFSNLPNQLLVMLWTRSVRDLQHVCTELERDGYFSSVVPNVLRAVYYFDR